MKATEMTAEQIQRLYHEHIETIREQLQVILKTHHAAGKSPLDKDAVFDLLSDINYYSETLRPWDEGEDDDE